MTNTKYTVVVRTKIVKYYDVEATDEVAASQEAATMAKPSRSDVEITENGVRTPKKKVYA